MFTNINLERKPVFFPFIKKPELPCFSLPYSDTGEFTVDNFLKAMRLERIEDAMVYVSKNYLDRINLEELSDVLMSEPELCVSYVLKTGYQKGPRNCIDRAFLVMNNGGALLFNISMLKEPNCFGKWKIYSIEREEGLIPYSELNPEI